MKRFIHIIILLALYNICGFCLKFSLPMQAAFAGCLFLIISWFGVFISLTRLLIIVLESGKSVLFT